MLQHRVATSPAVSNKPSSKDLGRNLLVQTGRGGRDCLTVHASTSYQGVGAGGQGSGVKLRQYKASDGVQHLGSSLKSVGTRPFPGPPPDSGPPLRILPIGGLGEIGMNCMMVGAKDRYIVIDAGLLFPDFTDLGMQKILPDTSFLYDWRDKIEALVITHGHEDHIGALPWVVPALDPSTPIYASSFVMQLVKKRMAEYSLWDEGRFRTFDMKQPFNAGPFEIVPIRVTHSIPDCCGLIMRSQYGTIVHTGDWKIDETPIDGEVFDRESFDLLGKEKVSLMMSDSTNVLSTGRTTSEAVVQKSIMEKVLAHQGKGRVICTQFASNLHRLYSVKKAADLSGRKICFIGASLNHYLEAAYRVNRAPFDPKDLIAPEQLEHTNPNEVLIVTTGSQAEPRAQLSLAARGASPSLKILPSDLLLYSAKVIPGNENKVTNMLNAISMQGARVMQGRSDMLHTSGHAYQDELVEVMRYVKPQTFLPVHGEYSFLCEHALLAREKAGVNNVEVIKNGQMLGVWERSSRNQVSSGSMAVSQVIGEVNLVNFYNDGGKGTGTREEMVVDERSTLAFEGVVVVSVDAMRSMPGLGVLQNLDCKVRVTTRGMWTDQGRLLEDLHKAIEKSVQRLPATSSLYKVEQTVVMTVQKACRSFNLKRPEVICIAHEHDPRDAHMAEVADRRRASAAAAAGASTSSYGARAAGGRGAGASASGRGGAAGGQMLRPGAGGAGGAARRPWSSARQAQQSALSDDEWQSVAPAQAQPQPASSGSDEDDSAGSSSGAAGDTTSSTGRMLRVRRDTQAGKPSGGRLSSSRAAPGPPPIQVLPEGVLDARKRRNPRDNPSKDNDTAFG